MAMRTIADVYKPLPASEVWNARMMGEKYKEMQKQKQVERLMAQALAEMNQPQPTAPQPGTQPPPTGNTIANLYRQGTPEAAQAATALESREKALETEEERKIEWLMSKNPEGAVAYYNNSIIGKKYGKAQYLGKQGDWNIIKSEDGSETAHRTTPSGELESREIKPAATVPDKYKMEDGHIFNETKGVATPIPGYTPKKEFAVSDGFMYDKGTGKGSTIPGYTPRKDVIDTASQAAFDDLDKLYLKKASLESMRDEFGGIISSEDAQTSLATISSQIAKREALIKSRYPQEWATYSGGAKKAGESERQSKMEAGRAYYRGARNKVAAIKALREAGWGDAGIAEITGNAAAPAQRSGMPPNAKRARDGKWYVPDPKRPGKYLRVE